MPSGALRARHGGVAVPRVRSFTSADMPGHGGTAGTTIAAPRQAAPDRCATRLTAPRSAPTSTHAAWRTILGKPGPGVNMTVPGSRTRARE